MAYIGNPVQQALTKVTSQSFNGTGSQTVFTLNRAVNTGEELEVFVNNVQQEPGVGKSYTATGTTLTFDAAPASGTGNIYVIYRGIAEVTRRLEHDPNAALAATTGTFSDGITVDKNGATVATFDRATSDGSIVDFQKSGVTVGSIASTTRGGATDIFIGSGDTGIYFTQALDAVAPSNQGSDRDAAIDLGRSANRFKDLYLSGGVVFGATGGAVTSKTLDDYEEGTWAPTFTAQASNPTVSYDTQVGNYQKIGNTVYFSIHMGTGSVSGGSGDLYISGFPFASSSSAGSRSGSIGLNYTWSTNINPANWWMSSSDTKIYLYRSDNAASTVTVSNMGTGSSTNRLWIQGLYTTDA
jgi:hypothetical protein